MKKGKFLMFILVFGAAGYLRERFFEHMNIILASVYRGTDEYARVHQTVPFFMEPLLHWTYPQLYYSKYPFTLLWIFVFWLLGIFAIRSISGARHLQRYLSISFLFLIAVAAISMLIGFFINGTLNNDEYTFSRWLLGIAQSPLICLILLASEKLYFKSYTHDQQG